MTDQQQREQDAASAAMWCGWEVRGPYVEIPQPSWCGSRSLEVYELFKEPSYGAPLLVAAIKRKLVEEGCDYGAESGAGRVSAILFIEGEAVAEEEYAPTELDAFLAVLRAMGKIGGDGE